EPDRLLVLAIDPSSAPTDRTRTVRDLSERGAELPDGPGWSKGGALHEPERAGASLPALTDGELTDGPAHPLRARLARTIQEIGQRVRSVAERVRGAVRETGRLVTGYLEAAKRDRGAA